MFAKLFEVIVAFAPSTTISFPFRSILSMKSHIVTYDKPLRQRALPYAELLSLMRDLLIFRMEFVSVQIPPPSVLAVHSMMFKLYAVNVIVSTESVLFT